MATDTDAELSLDQQLALYDTDRAAWLAYMAPRMAALLTAGSDQDAAIRWPLMGREYQRAVWARLDRQTRKRIRAIREPA